MEGSIDQDIGLLCFILFKNYHGRISVHLENFPRKMSMASAVNFKNVVNS